MRERRARQPSRLWNPIVWESRQPFHPIQSDRPLSTQMGNLLVSSFRLVKKLPFGLRARWIHCYRKLRPMPKLDGHRPQKPLPARAQRQRQRQRQNHTWFMRPRRLFLARRFLVVLVPLDRADFAWISTRKEM